MSVILWFKQFLVGTLPDNYAGS